MSTVAAPASVSELAELVRNCARLVPVGAGTKPRLSAVEATRISTRQLQGIVEYEPSEFTFTARAGTSVGELAQALGERGQYLPFDPLLLEAGATLGGTVAAGLSGPGRLRFGGVRDFILGVRFVDGLGRVLRMGGKVVKNAAGFDLPKFFVGSLGRFGVLSELTFKVFPAPVSTLTLKLAAESIQTATEILVEAARGRWEPQALDIPPGGTAVCLRLAGPAEALTLLAREILARWPGELLSAQQADMLWSDLREFRWAPSSGSLLKVGLNPTVLPPFHRALDSLPGARLHVSAGGNLAFVSFDRDATAGINALLRTHGLAAMTFRGTAPLWCGVHRRPEIEAAVKLALDPLRRFPDLNE